MAASASTAARRRAAASGAGAGSGRAAGAAARRTTSSAADETTEALAEAASALGDGELSGSGDEVEPASGTADSPFPPPPPAPDTAHFRPTRSVAKLRILQRKQCADERCDCSQQSYETNLADEALAVEESPAEGEKPQVGVGELGEEPPTFPRYPGGQCYGTLPADYTSECSKCDGSDCNGSCDIANLKDLEEPEVIDLSLIHI